MAKDTKERILEKALEMFSEKGYEGTNIREITAALGLVKSSMYRHFGSKEEIWNALLDEMEAYYDANFASPERMMRYLGLEPGSVSPFGLINDTDHHVHLFLDSRLQKAETLSFHPNDCRGTVVIRRTDFESYLKTVGNTYEYIDL